MLLLLILFFVASPIILTEFLLSNKNRKNNYVLKKVFFWIVILCTTLFIYSLLLAIRAQVPWYTAAIIFPLFAIPLRIVFELVLIGLNIEKNITSSNNQSKSQVYRSNYSSNTQKN